MRNVTGPASGRLGERAPAPARSYYTLIEVARDILGISPDHLYRRLTRERLHARGLPRPYQEKPWRWDRASVDAWKSRFHPLAPRGAANDVLPPPQQNADADWQAALQQDVEARRKRAGAGR